MSKYNKTKFYWLQLKEDFFEDDAIQWLEEQKPKGRDYAYFYLKLCLKSLKTNGLLIRRVGNVLIPYDTQKLAELTRMDFDTVTVAMTLLKQIGLIQVLDSGEIFISQLENLIGSKSVGALKKQQQRLLGGQMEDKCPPKIDIDIELDTRDRTKDIDKNKTKTKVFIPPTLEEVQKYCEERNNNVDAQKFYDYYSVANWKDKNGDQVKNWKQKMISNWEKNKNMKEENVNDRWERISQSIENSRT